MSVLITQAALVAADRHKDQKRKYTGEPYFIHLAEVAYTVATRNGSEEMIAAAYLHDAIEDAGVTQGEISDLFGPIVSGYVYWLTDATHDKGNRATRKVMDIARLKMAPEPAKTIKLADLISNTQSIVERDPKFAMTYLPEKRAVLDVLRDADQELWHRADRLVQNAYTALGIKADSDDKSKGA